MKKFRPTKKKKKTNAQNMDNEFGMHDVELEDIIEKPVSRVKVNIFNFELFELLKKKSKFFFFN